MDIDFDEEYGHLFDDGDLLGDLSDIEKEMEALVRSIS